MAAQLSENKSNVGEENYPLSRRGRNWVIFFVILMLLAFIVPFTLLTDVQTVSGAFLFWSVFALVAIICVGIITANWRDVD